MPITRIARHEHRCPNCEETFTHRNNAQARNKCPFCLGFRYCESCIEHKHQCPLCQQPWSHFDIRCQSETLSPCSSCELRQNILVMRNLRSLGIRAVLVKQLPMLGVAAILLLASFSRWPYASYFFLKSAVCGVSFFAMGKALEQERIAWAILLFLNALFYNPLFPVRMRRDSWEAANIISSILLLSWAGYSLFREMRK